MSVEGSVRDRRRAETVAEIKAAALDQLATAGTGGLSLRGVARAVGMTVQSLYHYFDSRDALLNALVTDSHHALADAAEAAAAGHARAAAAGAQARHHRGVPEWALANTSAFLLLYGTPVPGFDPGPASESGSAALRLAGRSPRWCSTGGRPPSSPPSRCPTAVRPSPRPSPEGRAARGCARVVHRAARAHARPGDAGAPGSPVAVRGGGRAVLRRRDGPDVRRARRAASRDAGSGAACYGVAGRRGTSSRRRGAGARAGCRWPRACRWSARWGWTGRSAPGG